MRFDIIGAGAIGLSLAARLAAAGMFVTIWTRTEQQATQLREQGILYESVAGSRVTVPVDAHASESSLAPEEMSQTPRVIMLTVKQTHVHSEELQACIRRLRTGAGAMLCLQNGIGHMDKLRELHPNLPMAEAVTTEGALRVDERTVRQTGVGELRIGELRNEVLQKKLNDALIMAGIKAVVSKNIKEDIYRKLLVNAVINPLTALYGIRNGALPHDRTRLALMRAIYEESIAILQTDGYQGSGDEWERTVEVCKLTGDNSSSMLVDLREGRQTEIEAINGGIVRLAKQAGMPAPLNEAAVAWVKAAQTYGYGEERTANGSDMGRD